METSLHYNRRYVKCVLFFFTRIKEFESRRLTLDTANLRISCQEIETDDLRYLFSFRVRKVDVLLADGYSGGFRSKLGRVVAASLSPLQERLNAWKTIE
jgi:hypothetical protein